MPAPVTELSTGIKVAGPAFESRRGRKARESGRPCQRSLWGFGWCRRSSIGVMQPAAVRRTSTDTCFRPERHQVRVSAGGCEALAVASEGNWVEPHRCRPSNSSTMVLQWRWCTADLRACLLRCWASRGRPSQLPPASLNVTF